VNVSVGATRTMRLRTKKAQYGNERESQTVRLVDASAFVLDWETNRGWLHSIKPDKRDAKFLSPDETVYGGKRISLTFRDVATFVDDGRIFGQGATAKTRDDARDTVAHEGDSLRLLEAFANENHDPEFDWDAWYGPGFDVAKCSV
jgi:2OG-Fe(II) oxygenase superfamily